MFPCCLRLRWFYRQFFLPVWAKQLLWQEPHFNNVANEVIRLDILTWSPLIPWAWDGFLSLYKSPWDSDLKRSIFPVCRSWLIACALRRIFYRVWTKNCLKGWLTLRQDPRQASHSGEICHLNRVAGLDTRPEFSKIYFLNLCQTSWFAAIGL